MKTRISLKRSDVLCLIGCLNKERVEKQPIQVDVTLIMNGMPPLPNDKISDTCDYTKLAKQIGFILEAGRFHLLETAARFVTRYLMLPNLHESFSVDSVELSLTKFDVVGKNANASVSVHADKGDFQFKREIKSWGSVDVIDENSRLGLYKLNILPGQKIENHYHNDTREAELVLSSAVEISQDLKSFHPASSGEIFYWKAKQCHGYKNSGASTASILCVDEPPFKPGDEIIKEEAG